MATCGQQQMAMASGQAGSWLAAGNVRPDAILTVNMSSEFLYIRFGSCKLIVQNCRRRNVFPLLHPLPATRLPPSAIRHLPAASTALAFLSSSSSSAVGG